MKTIITGFSFLLLTFFYWEGLGNSTNNQSKNLPYIIVDTSQFQPNDSAGWGVYACYIEPKVDTTILELVLYRNIVDTTLNWQNNTKIGKLGALYQPRQTQTIQYNEPPRTWQIQIQQNGEMYLQLLTGDIPQGNPVVIPIKTTYLP